MKRLTLIAAAATALIISAPAYAQRSHPSPGGPPAGRGPGSDSGMSGSHASVAAAHVAKNLEIPGGFDALKAKVTGSGAVSLGKAIEGLAPNADAKAEAKKAKKQASDDLSETSS